VQEQINPCIMTSPKASRTTTSSWIASFFATALSFFRLGKRTSEDEEGSKKLSGNNQQRQNSEQNCRATCTNSIQTKLALSQLPRTFKFAYNKNFFFEN